MKDKDKNDASVIETNRFIREWDENLARERETRNALGQKHRKEHENLSPEEVESGGRILLITRHTQEIEELKQQHARMRKAIAKRQMKETKMLTERFNSIIQHRAIQVNRLSSVNPQVYSVMVHA